MTAFQRFLFEITHRPTVRVLNHLMHACQHDYKAYNMLLRGYKMDDGVLMVPLETGEHSGASCTVHRA